MKQNNDWTFVQDQIGYPFNNLALLQQAFTRKSYTEENGGENNEVLEFIGDKVLDLIVIKLLIEKNSNSFPLFQKHDPATKRTLAYACNQLDLPLEDHFICSSSEEDLTEIKKMLVQKSYLAHRINCLGIASFLIMSEGDRLNNIDKQRSVQEDLFEAILGAVAIDCNWDLRILQNVTETMLAPKEVLSFDQEVNYIKLIEEWTSARENNVPQYHFEEAHYSITECTPFDGKSQPLSLEDPLQRETRFHCLLKISDQQPIFRGFGTSKSEARKNVCKFAYDWLNKQGLWLSIRDELQNPNPNEAISQLEILARRGYFSIPTYEFKENHDQDGNPVWTCECHIEELKTFFTSNFSSKKDAKKNAAYQMLQYVLETQKLV